MSDDLAKAKAIAAAVRYSGDRLRAQTGVGDGQVDRLRGYFAQAALRISPEVTPTLHARLEAVYRRLQVPPLAIDAYVQCSPEIQAECFTGHSRQCVIRFSSALVDILDDDEFTFVVGHELGHFLLNHGSAPSHQAQSIEHFMQQRSQEISVDRLGLIACGSLDVAVKALMKTISGLTSNHLRFDVGTFIAQLRRSPDDSMGNDRHSTHPSILVRCRALLWFSLSEAFASDTSDGLLVGDFGKLDRRVDLDFKRYVDGPARRQIQSAKDEVAMWSAALAMSRDGIFVTTEQSAFADMFGSETLIKLKNLLRDLPRDEGQAILRARFACARVALEALIPESFASELEKIEVATMSLHYRAQF